MNHPVKLPVLLALSATLSKAAQELLIVWEQVPLGAAAVKSEQKSSVILIRRVGI